MPTIYAIGRNYAEHAREMGSRPDAAGEAVVFLKPWRALVAPPGPVEWPKDLLEVHHEVEIVVRVGAGPVVEAVAVGLDLTDRARQGAAKKEGLPWARSKGFKGSAPVGPFVPAAVAGPLDRLRFSLRVGGELRQRGDTADMLRPIPALLADLDAWFGLLPGDLVFTGTPEGVGPLRRGDDCDLEIQGVPQAGARFTIR